jgi:hypothetical protein
MKTSDGILIVMLLWILVGSLCAIFKVSFDKYGLYWFIVSLIIIVFEFAALCKERKKINEDESI